MLVEHARGNQSSRICLLDEIVASATKKKINATTHVGSQEYLARLSGRRRHIRRKSAVREPGLHLGAPWPLQFARPMILKRRHVLRLEKSRDIARSSDHPPVE
jgi:hypothetical protein